MIIPDRNHLLYTAMTNKSLRYDEKQGSLSEQIAAALREIKFGSVEIIIHNGRAVQIEKKEKIRFVPEQSAQ